jgi:hypothetical protein
VVTVDAHVQRVLAADPRQRLAQRPVDVDVGGAPVEHVAVEGEHVEPGVDAAAGGERLEPEPLAVARHDRVAGPPGPGLVVAGERHVGHGQQPGGGRGGVGEQPAEEPGVGLRAG